MAYTQYVKPVDNLYDTPKNTLISKFKLIYKSKQLLICEDYNNIIITNKQQNNTVMISTKSQYITNTIFAKKNNIIICSTEFGSVLFYKLDGTLLKKYDERKEPINILEISKNNELYATYSKNSNIINILHFDTDELLQSIKIDDLVKNIIFTDNYFVIGCNKYLYIYNFKDVYKFYKEFFLDKIYIKLLSIDNNGIIIIYNDLSLYIINIDEYNEFESSDETQFIMSNIIENYITNDISNLILF